MTEAAFQTGFELTCRDLGNAIHFLLLTFTMHFLLPSQETRYQIITKFLFLKKRNAFLLITVKTDFYACVMFYLNSLSC